MKTIISCFLLLFGIETLAAQDYQLYWKYKDFDDGINLEAPRSLITIGSWFVPAKEDRKWVRKVHRARVMFFEGANPVTKKDMVKFNKRAKKRGLEDLIYVREGGSDTQVRVMIKDRRDAIRKLVVLVSAPDEFIMVTIKGKLKWEDINRALRDYGDDFEIQDELPPTIIKVPI
jgi:hypothetical protein